ncbi:MAG: hypothetical protein DRP02_13615 [Candidatus Gerdarchaeota archaeon]|nr:MAG: hypothetical protein DRP02_13615 [Candidatus Gerdarchaeota archaeon]
MPNETKVRRGLYKVSQEIHNLMTEYDNAIDPETGEVDEAKFDLIEARLIRFAEQGDYFIDEILAIIKTDEAQELAHKASMKEFTAIRRNLKMRIESHKKIVKNYLIENNEVEFDGDIFRASFRKTSSVDTTQFDEIIQEDIERLLANLPAIHNVLTTAIVEKANQGEELYQSRLALLEIVERLNENNQFFTVSHKSQKKELKTALKSFDIQGVKLEQNQSLQIKPKS